jgi:hypothetical protein
VNEAFRATMQNSHTDKGGSDYLTTKIIEARKHVGNGGL